MITLTYTIGGVLTAAGVIAYIATGAVSVTALIPAFVGVLLLICAVLARKPALRRHSIHAALVIALVGALGTLMNVAKLGALFTGTAERPSAIIVSTVMLLLLVFYLALGVRSFLAARRTSPPTQRS